MSHTNRVRNLAALAALSDGSPTARYEYGPFGEPIRLTGPAAAVNPFRFSTKRTEPTTDLVLYEYRAYSPTLGQVVEQGSDYGELCMEFMRWC
jgi:RHS repeat-associated protein